MEKVVSYDAYPIIIAIENLKEKILPLTKKPGSNTERAVILTSDSVVVSIQLKAIEKCTDTLHCNRS